jgi:hypothetical protein
MVVLKLHRILRGPEPRVWLVWSTERNAWLVRRPPGSAGTSYTRDLVDAGRFTQTEIDDHLESGERAQHVADVADQAAHELKIAQAKVAHEARRIAALVVLERVIRRAAR